LAVVNTSNSTFRRASKIIALLLPFLLLTTFSAFSQITISKINVSLEDIFFAITKQAGYNVIYKEEQIQKANKVSINVENASVTSVLDFLARLLPIKYSISGKNITIDFDANNGTPGSPPGIALTGKVTDASGNPLPGTTISIKNVKGIGAIVNSDGEFALYDIDPASTLEISHIGYDTRIIKLDNRKTLLIALNLQVRSLEEFVTNGYTSTPRKYEVGSIKKINFDQIPKQIGNNIFAAIQGRIPGMMITQQSGLPGSPYRVQIRGQRSIGLSGQLPNNSPLFVVDGVPFLSSSESISQKGGVLSNNPFSTLNPEDIESIEVLKDANATSIYGSLGANGVVLITTRRAKVGVASLNLNIYSGLSTITRAPDLMNTEEYLAMRKEAFRNDNEIPNVNNAPDLSTWNNNRYNNWKDLLIGGTAHFTDAHLRFAGGSQYTQFALSGGYNRETTVFPTDQGKSFTSASFNFSHKTPSKKLEFNLSASYGYDRNKLFAVDPTQFIASVPNSPNPFKEDGTLNFGGPLESAFSNPFAYLYQPYNVTMERLTTGFRLEYRPIKKLSLRTSAGYNLISCDEVYQIPIASQDPRNSPTGAASFATSKNRNWIIEPQVEYWDTTTNSNLKILVGSSLGSRTGISNLLDGFNYTNDAGLNSISNAGTVTAINDYSQYKVISAYALINYILQKKYIVEATVRRDGSSRFGPNRKFGNFASLAAGWIFTNEKLMGKPSSVLSFGKLRLAYGTSGNDQIGDYQFLDAWVNNTRNPYQNPTILPSRLANLDYHWEVQRSLDIGLDLEFFKKRFMLSATFNQGRTGDQLLSITLPVQTGFARVIRNYPALTQNRNLEIELTSSNIRSKDWSWNTSINISFLRNKLVRFPDLKNSDYGNNRFVIGKPLNIVWGYRTGEMDKNTGIYPILDRNGKKIDIPTSLPTLDDQVVLGTYDPEYFGGMENKIDWKNWQLQFLFQFVKQMGQDPIYSNDRVPGYAVNQPRSLLNRWVTSGSNAPYPEYTQSGNSPAAISWFFVNSSDLAFSDASYIRLKNISLTYDLPESWFRNLKIRNVVYMCLDKIF